MKTVAHRGGHPVCRRRRRASAVEADKRHGVRIYWTEGVEAHHLDQLADRPELEWLDESRTAADRIAAVCSNCHRMLHRRRRALTQNDLRKLWR